jgi:hypothetical protein
MIRVLLAALAVLAAADPADAQEGRWAVRAADRIVIVLGIERVAGPNQSWTGRMIRPDRFQLQIGSGSQPIHFSGVTGPAVTRRILRTNVLADGLELTVEGRGTETDHFVFRSGAGDRPRLYLAGIPDSYFSLTRAEPGEAVAATWPQGRSFAASIVWPTNPEMTAIFEADQADRASGGAAIDWSVVTPRDEARRARTLALVAAGALASGDDYWHAAFVLQHGSEPNDFLLAHTFAVVAAARGRADATWIAAASLDRYLQKSGRPQIYGTQYNFSNETQTATQDPYDRALVSDALRGALGVKSQAEQERSRTDMEARFRARAAPPAPAPTPPR